MSKSCNHCGNEIKWPEPYYKGALPLNPDGTEHRCKGKNQEVKVTPEQGKIDSPLQAKDFDEIQTQTLFDDGYSRAK